MKKIEKIFVFDYENLFQKSFNWNNPGAFGLARRF